MYCIYVLVYFGPENFVVIFCCAVEKIDFE